MSIINYASREIQFKIVYYGPGLGGKTTNIQYIYQKTSSQNKGQMITLNTENERTLFFDFLFFVKNVALVHNRLIFDLRFLIFDLFNI